MIQSLSEDPFYRYVFKDGQSLQAEFYDIFSEEQHAPTFFHYILRQNDNSFVGYLQGFYPENPYDLWIQRFIINKSLSHQGYGTYIMKQFLQTIQQNQFHQRIYLTCHKDNLIGHHFWTKLGFKKIKDDIQQTHNLYCADIRS